MLAESAENGNLRRDMTGACSLLGPGETEATIVNSTVEALLVFALSVVSWPAGRRISNVGGKEQVSDKASLAWA